MVQLKYNLDAWFKIFSFFSMNFPLHVNDVISLSPSTCMHLFVEKELWRVCTSYHAANQTNVLSGQIAYNQSK